MAWQAASLGYFSQIAKICLLPTAGKIKPNRQNQWLVWLGGPGSVLKPNPKPVWSRLLKWIVFRTQPERNHLTLDRGKLQSLSLKISWLGRYITAADAITSSLLRSGGERLAGIPWIPNAKGFENCSTLTSHRLLRFKHCNLAAAAMFKLPLCYFRSVRFVRVIPLLSTFLNAMANFQKI